MFILNLEPKVLSLEDLKFDDLLWQTIKSVSFHFKFQYLSIYMVKVSKNNSTHLHTILIQDHTTRHAKNKMK